MAAVVAILTTLPSFSSASSPAGEGVTLRARKGAAGLIVY